MRILRTSAVAALALALVPLAATAASRAPAAASYRIEKVLSGLTNPVYVASAPGDDRLFVVEQDGRIVIVENGKLRAKPFADLRSVVLSGGEQGLLSVAFHPDFAKNGRLFVYYTAKTQHQQVWELHAKPGASSISGAKRLLLDMADPFPNHNGGQLQFGPDGDLYIGTGDGGDAGDPLKNAQNPRSPLGKLLRIDVDRHPSGKPYGIPADNPFASGAKGLPIIYAWGLRNPWRWSFDRTTNDIWIGDVGQDTWEEVDHVAKGKALGANFGWSHLEGTHPFDASHPLSGGGRLVAPVAQYSHNDGCSITGGYIYRGPSIPTLSGRYVYGDFCSSRLWTIAPGSGSPRDDSSIAKAAGLTAPTGFGQGNDGTLYVLSQGGTLYRFAAP